MQKIDVLIIGAGAAGMMCAIEAGRRGRRVLLVDHANAPGEKIRISGGGRCNFTNLGAGPGNFISQNPHFGISALKRYSAADFIAKIDGAGIAWHEKTRGQLFCDQSALQVITMLTDECREVGVEIRLSSEIGEIERASGGFRVAVSGETIEAVSLVVASGGKSIPKMGASGLAYQIAKQFGLKIVPLRPALVPLTFAPDLLQRSKILSGVSIDAEISCNGAHFREGMLFTHRGVSGPSILQISSYWREGDALTIDMAPGRDVFTELRAMRQSGGRQSVAGALNAFVPKRLAEFIDQDTTKKLRLGDCSDKKLAHLAAVINAWRVMPVGSEGYRTAEVTLGGIDTDDLNQKTMMATETPGLYFIGEAVDVTGWLGGYNFQWAWSSGWAAGQVC